jgi:hypothetical protein
LTSTGLTAELNGVPQDRLDIEQVNDLIDLLNAEYIARHCPVWRRLG